MTPRQRDCLAIIERSIAATGVCPSYDELMAGLGLASKSGVNRLLIGLEEQGRIRRLPHRARAIEVVNSIAAPDLESHMRSLIAAHGYQAVAHAWKAAQVAEVRQ